MKRQKATEPTLLFKNSRNKGAWQDETKTRREREEVGKYTEKAAYFRSHTTVYQGAIIQGTVGEYAKYHAIRTDLKKRTSEGHNHLLG